MNDVHMTFVKQTLHGGRIDSSSLMYAMLHAVLCSRYELPRFFCPTTDTDGSICQRFRFPNA
jgi:hypothetical protein